MENDNHDLRVSARTARLTAGADDDDGQPGRFSGVAVAAGDIPEYAKHKAYYT